MRLISVYKIVILGTFFIFTAISGNIVQAQSASYYCRTICALAWSPSELNVLGIVNRYGLWLYDAADHNTEARLFQYNNAYYLSFAPTGSTIAVAACANSEETNNCNSSLALFDITTQTWETLAQYEYTIDKLKFSPDGRYIAYEATMPGYQGVHLIDLTTHETTTIAKLGFTDHVLDYAFDPQVTRIAISNRGLSGHGFVGITVWRLSDQTLERESPFDVLAPALAFIEGGTEIIFAEYDTQLSVWNLENGVITAQEQLVETMPDNLNTLRFTDDSAYLVASLLGNGSLYNRQLFVWETTSGTEVFALNSPTDDRLLNLIAINSAGTYVAFSDAVDERMLVEIWDRASGSIIQKSLML